MLAKKNRVGSNWVFFLALAVLLAGCTPPGPRALLDGKRLLDQGRYAEAIGDLKTATSLLPTNAVAWNYLGLAYHHAGQPANAEQAYQKALVLNHDIVEARFNLGSLWLEQNKLEAAKAQLTTYTQLRGNSIEGWLQLGTAQLRGREFAAAEKSFGEVLRLNPKSAEALNNMGLSEVQLRRPREAAKYFTAALNQRPNYDAALLNLAAVSQQYLNDRPLALQKYREYLALTPRPANWEAVNAVAQTLEQQLAPPRAAQTNATAQAAANTNAPPTQVASTARAASPPKPEPTTNGARTAPPAVAVPPATAAPPTKVEVVKLPPEAAVKPAQDFVRPTAVASAAPAETTPAVSPPPASAEPDKTARRGFFQRLNPLNLFRSEPKSPPQPTPLPPYAAKASPTATTKASGGSAAAPSVAQSATPSATTPSAATSAAPPSYPRYAYVSPSAPAAGNRADAERVFAQGLQSQRANRLAEAALAYRQAAQLDPSYFEAQFNLGLFAFEARNFRQALAAYENALALQPDSVDARYNFALTLKAANYPLDAAVELEKVVAANPNETRAHLTLGNLYAQQLQDKGRARGHYLRVLELTPRHPEATAIRYWLVANPP